MSNDLTVQTNGSGELVARAPEPPPAPLDELAPGAGSPGLRRVIAAVLRYRWWILVFTVLGTAVSAAITRYVKPQYTAEGTIWIDVGDRNPTTTQGPMQPRELLEASAWVDLLRSFAVLDWVVQDQRLYLTHSDDADAAFADFALAPSFRPGTYSLRVTGRRFELLDQGTRVDQGALGDSVGRRLGLLWRPEPDALRKLREVRFTVAPPRDAARELNRRLQARLPEGGNFLRLSYDGTDPQQVAAVVNAVESRYITVAAELKAGKTKEVARILGEQLQHAERNLRDSERELEQFRVGTITLPSERSTPVAPGLRMTENPVMSRYFDMKVQRETLAREREAIARALEGRGAISVDALATIDAVQKSAELKQALEELTTKRAALRALQQQFTDEHVAVRKAAAEVRAREQETVPRLARMVMADLAARESELDTLISSASRQLQDIPPRAIDEGRLERRVAVAEDLYNTLRRRSEEARLAAETSIPDVRILDRAQVPRQPASDPRILVVLFGFAGSLALGITAAVALDRVDRRLRYPEEVTRRIGLAVLGVIPGVATRVNAPRHELREVLEALRGIRLSLAQAYGPARPLVVTVSSPGDGDGKSFVVGNLGMAYADLGLHTLVVDGDIRRGALHRLLAGQRKPGLTDYLAGHVSAEAIVQPTSQPLLDLIGSGSRLPNAPELLSSAATGELLQRLRQSYDVILVDSPPLGASVDPYVLGVLTGAMLLVLRPGRTERVLTEVRLASLASMPIRVLGAVLNDVHEKSVYRYYAYASGYDAGEAVEGGSQLLPAVATTGSGP